MKFPAVAIASAFACGIAIGLWPMVANRACSRGFVFGEAAAALLFLAVAVFLLSRQFLRGAMIFLLAAWLVLGFFSAAVEQQPKPSNFVLNVIESGEIDLQAPLLWHGILRDEPAALPWGISYEIDLASVDYQERSIFVQGGLRASYTQHTDEAALPSLHAGDQVDLVAQARLPQLFRDEGAFDRRAYLRSQGIELTATLRSPEMLERIAPAKRSPRAMLAAVRRRLRETLSGMLANAPEEAAVLRAMLLGDRSFLDRSESVNFQKTGVFHVLVVAGLHVGAFAAFLFWAARKLKLSRAWTSLAVVACVLAYVAVVEQRPPVLRAALMTFVVVLALLFFRRVELLNSVAIAALVLLVASPTLLADPSFQLSFLSMFCIAGLAAPWLETTIEPFARGMRGWRDVTRDVSHPPRVAQFRIDLRSVAAWLEPKLPVVVASRTTQSMAFALSLFFRVTEMIILTLVLQIGMLPLLAQDFHRVALSGPLANLFAVPITGILVPLGFATLLFALVFPQVAVFVAMPLRWLTATLLYGVNWISRIPHWSYRIPGPPFWLVFVFLVSALILAIAFRASSPPAKWIKRLSFTFMLAAALAMATFPFAPRRQSGSLELSVLDVGQGDSLFLVFPAGHTLLVDGGGAFSDPAHRGETHGPDPGEEAVSAYLWSRGFKQIDVVALTHAHQDHIGGLTAIFDNSK